MGRTSISAKGRHGGCSSSPAIILPSEVCERAETRLSTHVSIYVHAESSTPTISFEPYMHAVSCRCKPSSRTCHAICSIRRRVSAGPPNAAE